MAKLSKRQQQLQEFMGTVEQPMSLEDGMNLIAESLEKFSKFNEGVEAHIRLGIDMKKADQQVRTTCVLPEGTGRDVRVAVVAKGEKVNEAKDAGADFYGSEELLEKIQTENWFDFDVLIATPDMMAQVGKLGKVLGPKGMMPNPKTGTVTADLETAIKKVKAGQIEIRPDKTSIVHIAFGRKQHNKEQLLKNFSALYDTIQRAKPAAAKGTYVKSVFLSTTQGPSVKLDSSSLNQQIKPYLAS